MDPSSIALSLYRCTFSGNDAPMAAQLGMRSGGSLEWHNTTMHLAAGGSQVCVVAVLEIRVTLGCFPHSFMANYALFIHSHQQRTGSSSSAEWTHLTPAPLGPLAPP